MITEPTREILWNIASPMQSIVMYGSMFLAILIAAIGTLSRIELWRSGKQDLSISPTLANVIADLTSWGALQRGVVKKKAAGVMHTLIYFGFLVLLFTTTVVAIHHDLGIKIYQGNFYLFLTVMSDVFGLGLIIGCMLAFQRRFISTETYLHNRTADWFILAMLVLLCLQGFILEGARIAVTNDQWASYSPVGFLFSKLFWGMSEGSVRTIHWLTWWWHTFTVFGCIALAPYSKFFHIISSLSNIGFRRSSKPKGQLPFPGKIEELMESAGDDFNVGVRTIKDYSWKQLLDLDACTSCGRCQEVCPAYSTGKPLSPKWIILDTRNHMLDLHSRGELVTQSILPEVSLNIDRSLLKDFFLPAIGYKSADKTWRAPNQGVQQAALPTQGLSVDTPISGGVIDPQAFWSCTTCMACVSACPVAINHVDQIIENRRNMVLMQGEIPHEAQVTLRALESRKNPFGDPNQRNDWTKNLDVKILQPGDSVDYLYWVGCVSAYDPRKQKIAKSLVKIMNAAGLSFGVLGNAEGCSGDPARRLGEENLYQTLASSNIELLKSIQFKSLVANCPHCFNTIKNEYPQLGNLGDGKSPEIIHHSVLLRRLLAEDKLTLKEEHQNYTFHDPCYLGRYNDEYEAPRESLKKVKGLQILEMEKSKEQGMCCGAGGGHFWMDLKIGTRVNQVRVEQAAATGASNIATACPFCLQMMEDGVKLNNLEESMIVKDIAEVIAENLETR
jgi:Fe-S oxidoreductase/nitrate reductase gamma subunit